MKCLKFANLYFKLLARGKSRIADAAKNSLEFCFSILTSTRLHKFSSAVMLNSSPVDLRCLMTSAEHYKTDSDLLRINLTFETLKLGAVVLRCHQKLLLQNLLPHESLIEA